MAAFWNKRENSVNDSENNRSRDEIIPVQQEKYEELLEHKIQNKALKASNSELSDKIESMLSEIDSMKKQIADGLEREKQLNEKILELSPNNNTIVLIPDNDVEVSTTSSEAESQPTGNDTAESAETLPVLSAVEIELKSIKEMLKDVDYKDRIIKELHDEVQKRNRDFYLELTKPYIKSLIKIFERLTGTYKIVSKSEFKERENAIELIIQSIEKDKLMVEDLLNDDYDIAYFEPKPGDSYLPKEHTSIQSIKTDEEEKVGKIAECKFGGFKNVETGKIFKNAIVTVYKLENNNN